MGCHPPPGKVAVGVPGRRTEPVPVHGHFPEQFIANCEGSIPENFVLVQNNATPHRARRTTQLLADEQVEVMEWPPMSPDMNPIEHVWDHIGRQIRSMENPPTSGHTLRQAVQRVWDEMPQEVIMRLIDSMPRRTRALAGARGAR